MICVTIAQESRRMVLADMLNAAMMGADMLEVRLDAFEHSPNIADMLAAKRVPLLFSCKRTQDGGTWKGTEDERLILLRQAILSKADYVEIEHDIADQIRPFPGSKRVVSYTNLAETPSDIAQIHAAMCGMKPDVIKLVVRARTPEEAWPLVQLLAKSPVPTAIVGLGRPGIMLSLLGTKLGMPWCAAALERGMEAFPGQPTVRDLTEIYRVRDINRQTRFIGVTGLGERESAHAAGVNAACVAAGQNVRALPMQVGNWKLFRKICDLVKVQGVTLEEGRQERAYEMGKFDETAKVPVLAADLLTPKAGEWEATNTLGAALTAAIQATYAIKEPDNPGGVSGRVVMVAGTGPLNRMVAACLKAAGANLIFAGKDRAAAQKFAQQFGGRAIAVEAVYQTLHDVLVVGRDGTLPDADVEIEDSEDEGMAIHPGYLRAGMIVADLTRYPRRSTFLDEAVKRACIAVEPARILAEQAAAQVARVVGEAVDSAAVLEAVRAALPEE